MLPWIELDRTSAPGGDALTLKRRGTEFSIMAGTTELMNSRLSGSEEQLATLSAQRLGDRGDARVLIGGLGMGFTLRAALAAFGADARITVAELVPGVIAWAEGPLAEIFGASLADPRVTVQEGDVGALVGTGRPWDAILLDVDNGPDGLSRPENDRLYGPAGLASARTALTGGGHLAVWSSARAPRFTRRLSQAGFEVEEVGVRARHNKRGARHVIWFATKR